MARSPRKTTPPKTNDPDGFGEAPQAGFDAASAVPEGIASKFLRDLEQAEDALPDAPPARARGTDQLSEKPSGAKTSGARTAAARTARGVSMGATRDPKARAAGGLNPVAGLDISLEDAGNLPQSGVTATVEALKALIETGRPEFLDGSWVPHRPPRPEKSEGGVPLKIESEFTPRGDQPQAIAELVEGVNNGEATQVLLGVTG
ncbi:MAG: excinuclease ABC subunit UvrB, partial [Hyphomicrobiaceae bacterium]|nr:excinuclease ABC subunit UvrB [Hyphomicrobiaceae bacterium]